MDTRIPDAELHSLLRRQLRRHFGGAEPTPETLRSFVSAVNEAYGQADEDRHLLERSLDLSSRELLEANAALRRSAAALERRVQERTEALRRAEVRFREFVEQLPVVTYIGRVGRGAGWVYVSPQILSLTGYTPEEWLADPDLYTAAIHPEDANLPFAAEHAAWERRRPMAVEYRLIARDGRVLWVRDEAVVVGEAEEGARLLRGVILDITAQKSLEQQLLQAQKMEAVGRLAGGVAHDFNNMLTAITGYASLLVLRLGEEAAGRETRAILTAAENAARLTRQLLAFSRRQVLQLEVLDLNILVGEFDGLMRRLIGEDIALTTRLAPGIGRVRVDRAQIEQVVTNLIVNARDAMPDGGRITVETFESHEEESAWVGFSIADTGTGMADAVKAHIFEPFFTTKPKDRGTGLGLATSYGIVRQSGGRIVFDSAPGRGTVFRVLLPRVDEPVSAPAPATDKGLPRGTETILVAEDEPAVRALVTTILADLGYRVLEAVDGLDALEVYASHGEEGIQLLVTDVVMPRLGGRDLAARLRARQPGLKVLYASGYAGENAGLDPLPPGSSFLQKPFSPDALARRVRDLLG